MVLPKNVNYAEIVNPLNANLPPTNYGQNSKSAVPDSKQRMKDAVRMHNQIFVVEGGTCGCTKGTKRARIKATNSTDTTFGKERALTLSCTEMIEDDIFGECKKLTEDKATKLGKNKKSIPPIMCKGHYTPISKKWSGSASTVSDNGENTIIITSTLKCEHGGKIEIMENGQGNGEVESLSRWLDQAMKGGYSNYNSRGGLVAEIVIGGVPIIGDIADARDFSHGIENGDLIEITTSLMGLLPYVGGIAKKGGSKVLRKIFRKKGAKVGEKVVEKASRAGFETGGRSIDLSDFNFDDFMKRLDNADIEYKAFRNRTDDVAKIAENTGIPQYKIERIKDHVFFKEHIKDHGVGIFDSDPDMADAWNRLINGNYKASDIDLLNHEYFESRFESLFDTNYRVAHDKTVQSGRDWTP